MTPARQFKAWKDKLCQIIRRESKLAFSPDRTQYSFVLPPKVVRLVWQTTIQEKAKLLGVQEQQALEQVRNEVDEAVEKVRDAERNTKDGMLPNETRAKEEVSEVVDADGIASC